MDENALPEQAESILELLDEMTAMVENAKPMPLSASILVNKSEMLEMLKTAAEIMPLQIVRADEVLQDAAKVSDDARFRARNVRERASAQAEQILAKAKQDAGRLTERESVVVAAKSRATQILDEAKEKANRISRGADRYSDSALDALSEQINALYGELDNVTRALDSLRQQIDAGRQVLARRRDEEQKKRMDAADALAGNSSAAGADDIQTAEFAADDSEL